MEKKELIRRLQELVHSYMGDTPINLSSPEQVSSMIFSYAPKDKKAHAVLYQLDSPFRPRISVDRFKKLVRMGCRKVMKTTASVCKTCKGTGKVRKIKKDGTPRKMRGRPKGSKNRSYSFHSETKAKIKKRRIVRAKEKKIEQIEKKLSNYKQALKKTKKVSAQLDKDNISKIITEDELSSTPKSIQAEANK